jgi:hypothetical protein
MAKNRHKIRGLCGGVRDVLAAAAEKANTGRATEHDVNKFILGNMIEQAGRQTGDTKSGTQVGNMADANNLLNEIMENQEQTPRK